MGTKLNVGGSVAIIAIALIVAQPIQSDAPTSMPGSSERFATMALTTTEPDQLASSSIIPAFISHTLPVANLADVVTDVVNHQQARRPELKDQTNSSLLKSAPENTSANTKRSENDTSEPESNAFHVNSPLPVRSRAEVAFLKPVTVIPDVIAGLPAVRTWTTRISERSSIKWPSGKPSDEGKTSTSHGKLHDFRAMLHPRGFQRGNWQDISPDVDLGSNKTTTKPFIVMIDPGHGGIDPGSKGHNGLLEKDLTLDIARRVRLFLTEFPDIEVELTRHHDHGLSRQSRVDAIKRSNADMVISLHFNHLPQTDVNLVESYYAGVQNIKQSLSAQNRTSGGELHRTGSPDVEIDLGFTEGSARLAKTLQQHIFSEVSFGNDQVQDAGVKQETLFVLTRSFTPAALIEISCLSHADEADRLVSDEYRNRLAASLVDGIRNYHDSIRRVPLKKRGNLGA